MSENSKKEILEIQKELMGKLNQHRIDNGMYSVHWNMNIQFAKE